MNTFLATDPVVEAALRTTKAHTRNRSGYCAGCLDLWGHLKPYPCTATIWAAVVLSRRYPC